MAGTSGIKAGKAYVQLYADNSKLARGLKLAENRLKAFGSRVSSLGKKMSAAMALAMAPAALSGKIFMGFDDQMRVVQAVTGATGKSFDTLTEKAKLLGKTTSFTAAQVASGMVELGRAGFSPKEIDETIASILDLSRATSTELAEATSIAGATLRSFSMDASSMGSVVDVLTAAANGSAQTLTDLGEAMKYAAPVADEYGISLQETAKIMGALANVGIKGSMAGTTLKNIMLQMADPAVQQSLAKLGVSATDSTGNLRSVIAIMGETGDAIKSMPSGKRLEIFNKLFGLRAVTGAAKLAKTDFSALSDAIDNAGGVAGRTSKLMDAGLGGSIRKLLSAVEGIAIEIGSALAGSISSVADYIGKVSGSITDWVAANRGLVVSITKIMAIILGVGVGLIAFGFIISTVGSAIGVLRTVLIGAQIAFGLVAKSILLLASPAALAVGAIAGIGVAAVWASGEADGAISYMKTGFNSLKDDAIASFTGIGDALASGNIGLAAKILWSMLKMEWRKGVNEVKKIWYATQSVIVGAWYGLKGVWFSVLAGMKKGWAATMNGYHTVVETTASAIAKTWARVQGIFDDSFDVDFAIKYIEQDSRSKLAKIDSEYDKEVAKINNQNKADQQRVAGEGQAVLTAMDEEHQQKMAANKKELEDAKAAWQAALDTAKAGREAVDPKDPPTTDPNRSISVAMDGFDAAMDGMGKKISAIGTFNAAGVRGMSAGSIGDNYASRTAYATEQTRYNTGRIIDKVDQLKYQFS